MSEKTAEHTATPGPAPRPIWGWTWISPTGDTGCSEAPFATSRLDAEMVCREADARNPGFRHHPLIMMDALEDAESHG